MMRVDARGMRCPWPALRLARAMREADIIIMVADDPAAAAEIHALADAHGWQIDGKDDEFTLQRMET